MIKDVVKLTREEISEKPGQLAAKIVYNLMCDNNFDLFFIGNTLGNTLYTVQLNNKERAIVCFTDESILQSYINRGAIRKGLNNSYGDKIVCVKINICTLNVILSEYMEDDIDHIDNVDETVRTIIVNPNTKDYFIPLNIEIMSSLIIDSGDIDIEDIDGRVDAEDLKTLEYDKEEKRFVFSNEVS